MDGAEDGGCCTDGDAEGFDDGDELGSADGDIDGTEDFSTHSRLLTKSSSSSDQQHFAVSQIPVFLEFMKHSDMKSPQIAM